MGRFARIEGERTQRIQEIVSAAGAGNVIVSVFEVHTEDGPRLQVDFMPQTAQSMVSARFSADQLRDIHEVAAQFLAAYG